MDSNRNISLEMIKCGKIIELFKIIDDGVRDGKINFDIIETDNKYIDPF